MSRARRWLPAAAVLAVAVLGACGIDAEPTANRIEPDEVPFGLLDPEPTTTVPTEGRQVGVHFLANEELLVVDRTLPSDGSLGDLLELLVAGPTEPERDLGVTSALPTGTIGSVDSRRGTAEVDLTSAFGELRSGEQILALAQVVYTLTGQPGIGNVAFTLEGEQVEVPRSDGTTSDEPLSRDDFSALAPD